jgi:hypothetical protein
VQAGAKHVLSGLKAVANLAFAGAVLVELAPDAAADVQSTLTSYLATLPDGEAKTKGIKLGQEVAAKILEVREKDGASAADAYRPRTKPGVYIPTPITFGWQLATMTPFALAGLKQRSGESRVDLMAYGRTPWS